MSQDKDAEVRLSVERALDAARGSLCAAEISEVQEFLDANENALALETLVGIFVEERRVPPPTLRVLVIEAATLMSMDPRKLAHELTIIGDG